MFGGSLVGDPASCALQSISLSVAPSLIERSYWSILNGAHTEWYWELWRLAVTRWPYVAQVVEHWQLKRPPVQSQVAAGYSQFSKIFLSLLIMYICVMCILYGAYISWDVKAVLDISQTLSVHPMHVCTCRCTVLHTQPHWWPEHTNGYVTNSRALCLVCIH